MSFFVISSEDNQGRGRLHLITLTEFFWMSQEANLIYYALNKKKWKSWFFFFTDGKQHKARKIDMITLRNHAPWQYMTRVPMTLSVLDMIIV